MTRKILFIADNPDPWGPLRQWRIWVDALIERSENIQLIQLGSGWQDFHCLDVLLTPFAETRYGLFFTRRLVQLVRSIQPDLVHTWGLKTQSLRIAWNQWMPWVATSFDGGDRDSPTLNEWAPRSLGSFALNRSMPFRRIHHCSCEPAGRPSFSDRLVISNSVRESDPVDRSKNGLQLRGRLGIRHDTKVICSIADLVPRHNLKDLIWAIDLLCCIRNDVHLVLIGRGPQLWRLQRFLRTTESLNNVHFLTGITEEELLGADLYWNSQTDCEPPGLWFALSHSIPVVSTAVNQPLLKHQVTAMLTEPGSRDQFARWTKFLLEHPDAGEIMAAQARTAIGLTFPAERMIQTYQGVYDSLLR